MIPFFATAVPSDSAEAPQISQIIGITWIQMLSWTGTCSSSPPTHTLFLLCIFNSLA